MDARKFSPLICFLSCGVCATSTTAQVPQYNRDVRPILADKCFRCHGPDAAARQAELRLDERKSATAARSGRRVIAPGKPANSELVRRITSGNPDLRMPPSDSGLSLLESEIDILRRWVESGADYQPHWSFLPAKRPSIPRVTNRDWPRNAIDHFVLKKLEQHGMRPSDPADRSTLIRRVTLDLTGLPPTLEEIVAFEQDSLRDSGTAWQKRIDRLLASPRYGERMAQVWLDAARYADTNGYFTDNDRTMWPWRDWVIASFNDNMPYDQFTIEQLAGDLLPDATIGQKIATGFNRNHMVNNETGIVEEEFRVEYVVDRVETTATVWMGLTLGCARCHDHKYDPISQKDFFRFFSFFNNVPERGLSGSGGNSAPVLKVPDKELQAELDRARQAVSAAERELSSVRKKLEAAQRAWEQSSLDRLPDWSLPGLKARFELDEQAPGVLISGRSRFASGMVGRAAEFDGDTHLRIDEAARFDWKDSFSFGGWIRAEGAGCVISKIDDAAEMRGFDVTLRKGKALVNLVHQWNRNAIRVATVSRVPNRNWQHLFVTYDGTGKARGVGVYLNGVRQEVVARHDNLTGTIANREPLRIGQRRASASYKGLIDEVQLYDRQLSAQEVQQLFSWQLIRGILTRPASQRNDEQNEKLKSLFLRQHADPDLATAFRQSVEHRRSVSELSAKMPTTMVMEESKSPRTAFVLTRGQYDQKGKAVTAGVPEFLAGQKTTPITNRLEMADWLVHPDHPLTARVTVNRLWQQLFGTGIVKSVDDFGTQGDWPSHPALLDWLSAELVSSGWNVKHILRLMVSSATYRQSAKLSPDSLNRDHDNRLLSRGPRFRMDAELIRDQALAISGLLVERPGGPSVKPYQPDGLWAEVTYDSEQRYSTSRGPSLYRRSLYTFWKRQAPPPNMLIFDAPTRETCTVQRSRTNTPLQALVLMNDPVFIEAARKLAERMMTEPPEPADEKVAFAFRLATGRTPTRAESDVFLKLFSAQVDEFSRNPMSAGQLLKIGQSTHDQSLDAVGLASWTTVASLILCLDETITRP